MPSTLDRLAQDVGGLLQVVGQITGVKGGPRQLLAALGWDLPPGVVDIGLAAVDFSTLQQRLEALQQAIDSEADDTDIALAFAAVLSELEQAFTHLRGVINGLSAAGDYLDKTQIKDQFLGRLHDLVVASRVGAASPLALLVLQFFGIISLRPFRADPSIYQVEHLRSTVDWQALPKLFKDPVGLLKTRYGWGTANFDGVSFITNLSALLEAVGEPVRLRALPRRVEEQLSGRFVPEADTAPATQLIASITRGDASSGLDAGLSFFPLRPTAPGATDGGFGLNPFVHGYTSLQFQLAPLTTLELESSAALDSGVVLQFRAGSPASLKSGLLGPGGVVDGANGKALIHVKYVTPAGSPQTLIDLPGGGFVRFDALTFTGGAEVSEGTLSPSFGLQITGAHAALKSEGADSFLSSILPGGGFDLHFDLGLQWSAAHGFTFTGSASAELETPLSLSFAGLHIDRLHVGVRPSDSALAFEVSVAGGGSIGPVSFVLDRIGALASFAFREGNLGPIDASLGFKGPSGIGLAIDAHGVSGGGFLFHDETQGIYAGAMQLSLQDQLTLKAFGLLATRLPDGSRGYSLIVFITAEDFRPIQLGLGFTLLGVGGMVGIHRTFDQDVLRQGLKSGMLAALLFPRDPVGNAPSLIRSLASAFPARQGSYLLGLLAKIGWFTPTLVSFDLALILEFGARERLLALGRISALLPSQDNDLVRLNMEALGVIDFDAATVAVDAVLIDSRIAHKFPMTGSSALRGGFGSGDQSFVLAVGGFNPRYAPPAGFPALERAAIALSSGNNPRLVCEAYFAITANTLQFGANASLYASAAGFSVEGNVGFDVLLQFVPLHFIADFHAKLQLKRGSHNLFMVKVNGELEGPRPLRISGKATFEILWCDFTVHFDATLVHGDPPPLPPAVNVLEQLTQALLAPSNWSTQRDAAETHGVALRSLPPPGPNAPLVLDPLGFMRVKQQTVPLNTARDIDTFGGAPVAGDRRFFVTATLSGGAPLKNIPLQAGFAPAQFFNMDDDERLAAPSFESMDAGYVFGDEDDLTIAEFEIIPAPLKYLPISITLSGTTTTLTSASTPQPVPYTLTSEQLTDFARSGAAARAPVRNVGRARYRNDTAPAGVVVKPKVWTIAPTGIDGESDTPPAASSASALAAGPAPKTWSEYHAALKLLNRSRARFQLLPLHELEP